MTERNRLDFDQKIAWLQKLSQPAMSEILTASHQNLLELVTKPSFSFLSGFYHHLLGKRVKSMYKDNQAVLRSIEKEVEDEVGEPGMKEVEWIENAAVRETWLQDTWQNFVEGHLGYNPSEFLGRWPLFI
ncbi:hypothetical protein CROQUDRAFT_662078, partial [Cronartium quercuum f. sp. fusiforme G11]